MFGMKIKMNEEKILKDKKIKIEDVYALIDKEIIDKNLKIGKINKDGTRMYWGPNSKDDFGGFCMVINHLVRIPWFLDNCSLWLWGDNEHDPKVWDWEDVLTHQLERRSKNGNS